ncbi:MAG TPA: DMT family transporter [Longimicrobiales bacterium]|nr:DMT family transporter [Longimicrobiales bacterium]
MSPPAAPERRVLGYLEVLAAAFLWGSSGIFTVSLFRLGVPPETIAIVRPVFGTLLLLAGFALARPVTLRVSARGLLVLGLGGGAAVGVFQLAYQSSIDAVGVPATVAVLYLAPPIVAAASGPLLGEWPSRGRVALIVLTVAGVWLSVLGAEEVETTFGTTGLAWGLVCALTYAAYTLLGRFATPVYGAGRVVLYSTAGACAVLALALPVAGAPVPLPPSAEAWLVLLAFGALTIAGAQFLFFDALGRIDASAASVAAAAEPAVAAVLATLLLSQGLEPLGWAGIAMIVVGVAGAGLAARAPAAPTS